MAPIRLPVPFARNRDKCYPPDGLPPHSRGKLTADLRFEALAVPFEWEYKLWLAGGRGGEHALSDPWHFRRMVWP